MPTRQTQARRYRIAKPAHRFASSVLAVSVQAWFSNDGIELDPGSSVTLKLSVQNLGEATESYTLVPSGLTADWINIDHGALTLFGGSSDTVDIVVEPPRLPTTSAGPTAIGVRIIPNDVPDDTIVAETTLDVLTFDDRRIHALQPVMRARRRADYEFMVENHGNALASCRLRLVDPSERIDGSFDPPAVGVAPGGSSLVRLKARAKRGLFRRATRTMQFEIEAEQPGHDPTDTELSFVQPSSIPLRFVGRLAAVAATLGLIAASWFHVVKPEIRDAANDKVDERLDEFDQKLSAIEEASDVEVVDTVVDVVDEDPVSSDEGEPFDTRLSVVPAQLETADAAFTVPNGQLFDVTDYRLENSNGDTGKALILVNGEERYTYSLGDIRGFVFEPSLTPDRLQPGDNITLSVRCDTVGDPALGTCSVALNLGGRTIEVDEL